MAEIKKAWQYGLDENGKQVRIAPYTLAEQIVGKLTRGQLDVSPNDIGAAVANHTHLLSTLEGKLSIDKGGFGGSTAEEARQSLMEVTHLVDRYTLNLSSFWVGIKGASVALCRDLDWLPVSPCIILNMSSGHATSHTCFAITTPDTFTRAGTNSGWYLDGKINNDAPTWHKSTPPRIEKGSSWHDSVPKNGFADKDIVFAAPFSNVPIVLLSLATTLGGGFPVGCSRINVTKAGFTIRSYNWNQDWNANVNTAWVAIGE